KPQRAKRRSGGLITNYAPIHRRCPATNEALSIKPAITSSQEPHHLLIKFRSDPYAADRLLELYRPALKLLAQQMVGSVNVLPAVRFFEPPAGSVSFEDQPVRAHIT